jgi:hypothetical protein
MRAVANRAAACALGGMALAALLALGGCSPEMQARAEASGTARNLGAFTSNNFSNDNFGVRQPTPGYLYDRGRRGGSRM